MWSAPDGRRPAFAWKPLCFYGLVIAVLWVAAASEWLNRLAPLPMGGDGYCVLALLIFAVLSWCLMLAPIAVTALLLLALVPFTGLMTFPQAVQASFGDSTFAFFLGVLLLSGAFQKTPLGQRIVLLIFRVFGRRPRAVLLGLMLSGMLLALLGQGAEPYAAACAAVWLHGCAGDRAAQELGEVSMLPSDLIRQIAAVVMGLQGR